MKIDNKTKQYLVIGGGILLAGTSAYFGNKLVKKMKLKKDLKNYSKASLPSGVNYIESARQIGMDLGIAYPSWDPRSWTENDGAVRDEIMKFTKAQIPRLKQEYAKLYSRDLQADLQKLNSEYWPKYKNLFL